MKEKENIVKDKDDEVIVDKEEEEAHRLLRGPENTYVLKENGGFRIVRHPTT